MTQFHEGQGVEVKIERSVESRNRDPEFSYPWEWRKAKIFEIWDINHWKREYTVEFPDGRHAGFFGENHIRAVPNRDRAKMTPDEFQEDVNDCYGGDRP